MRIAIVTCAAYPELYPSDALYRDALERLGAEVETVPWNGAPAATLAALQRADAAVLRAPWDYPQHFAAFIDWIAACEAHGIRLLNPPALVRWNADKRYLRDLQHAGVSVPPFRVLPPDVGAADLREALATLGVRGDTRAVLKPVRGGSGLGVVAVAADTAAEALSRLRADAPGCPLIVQTLVPEIVSDGEISLVFVGGRFAHAVRKRPAAGEFRVNTRFAPPPPEAISPAAVVLGGAERVLRALPGDRPPLYARIDGVEAGSGFLCLEAEVVDPALFLHLAPESAGLLAAAALAAAFDDSKVSA